VTGVAHHSNRPVRIIQLAARVSILSPKGKIDTLPQAYDRRSFRFDLGSAIINLDRYRPFLELVIRALGQCLFSGQTDQ